jgi:hypothetical protein
MKLDSYSFRIAILFATVLVIIVAGKKYYNGGSILEPTQTIYDTDPECNRYIKADLRSEQLQRLDKILLKEKRNHGERLPMSEVQAMAGYDQTIADAYVRWRKCVDMMRGSNHVVYPDERPGY